MRFRQLSRIVCVVLSLFGTAFGTTTATRDAQAITVISQSLAAMGIIATPTLETVAQGNFTDRTGAVFSLTIETAGTDRLRVNLGTNHSFVTNGGSGFTIDQQGVRHKLPYWTTKYRRPEHLPSLSSLSDYLDLNLQLQYVGLEMINGSSAHHIRLSRVPVDSSPASVEDGISEYHVWIDATSFLVVETRSFYFSPETPQNRTPVETYFTNYQQQGGAMIPFHITSYISGQQDSDIVITGINLNASIPDSDFQ
jgi:hypothetical protein